LPVQAFNAVAWREVLLKALERLAAPADTQILYLREIGTFPLADELALEFNDAVVASWQLVEAGLLTQTALDAALALDDWLKTFSGMEHASEWRPEALHFSSNWSRARELAREALNLMG
jgi:hypothetical protein